MPDKTAEQLQAELNVQAALREERKTSDNAYAVKIVERIVFGFLAILATAVVGGIVDIVISHFK
jgi:cell division septal protein FtsQ